MSRDSQDSDTERGVIDRITDGWAVILVGDREQERKVREDDLPDGAREGTAVEVRSSGMRVEIVAVDDEATDAKRSDVRDRLDRLKKRRSKGRFE